jgi:hypothetical protein
VLKSHARLTEVARASAFRGLEVDYRLKLGRPPDGQVARPREVVFDPGATGCLRTRALGQAGSQRPVGRHSFSQPASPGLGCRRAQAREGALVG